MKIADKVAVGIQAGVETIQSTGRGAAEKAVHVGADKAAVGTITAGSLLGGVGIAAAVSAALSQMDFEEKKSHIKNLFREEIASMLGKKSSKVRDGDVDKLAAVNHTVGEQMAKTRRERLLNVGTIFAATMASVGMVALAIGTGMFAPLAAVGGGATLLGGVTVGGALAFAAKAAVAMTVYTVVKKPLQKLADKTFRLDEKTTFERIEEIHRNHQKGKSVSQEQVFAVFVSANKELRDFVRAHYEKDYDDLSVADKEALTKMIGSKLNVEGITDDINNGRVKATELAFTVEGTMSGMLPQSGDASKQTVLMTVKERLHGATDYFRHENEPAEISHVQRLEESRAAQQSMLQQR